MVIPIKIAAIDKDIAEISVRRKYKHNRPNNPPKTVGIITIIGTSQFL